MLAAAWVLIQEHGELLYITPSHHRALCPQSVPSLPLKAWCRPIKATVCKIYVGQLAVSQKWNIIFNKYVFIN